MIQPGGQKISQHQPGQPEGFPKKALESGRCRRKHQEHKNDPVRYAHEVLAERTMARPPTRVPSIADMPQGTFHWSATLRLGEEQGWAVACSSELLRGSPSHTACRTSFVLCRLI